MSVLHGFAGDFGVGFGRGVGLGVGRGDGLGAGRGDGFGDGVALSCFAGDEGIKGGSGALLALPDAEVSRALSLLLLSPLEALSGGAVGGCTFLMLSATVMTLSTLSLKML